VAATPDFNQLITEHMRDAHGGRPTNESLAHLLRNEGLMPSPRSEIAITVAGLIGFSSGVWTAEGHPEHPHVDIEIQLGNQHVTFEFPDAEAAQTFEAAFKRVVDELPRQIEAYHRELAERTQAAEKADGKS
jgi:hypothetical protein